MNFRNSSTFLFARLCFAWMLKFSFYFTKQTLLTVVSLRARFTGSLYHPTEIWDRGKFGSCKERFLSICIYSASEPNNVLPRWFTYVLYLRVSKESKTTQFHRLKSCMKYRGTLVDFEHLIFIYFVLLLMLMVMPVSSMLIGCGKCFQNCKVWTLHGLRLCWRCFCVLWSIWSRHRVLGVHLMIRDTHTHIYIYIYIYITTHKIGSMLFQGHLEAMLCLDGLHIYVYIL